MACENCEGEKCKGECQDSARSWTIGRARELCRALEEIAPTYGAHVALTGGCLYRKGPRKDCDIVIYRHGGRQEPIDRAGFLAECVKSYRIEPVRTTGRVWKLLLRGRQIDFLWHDSDEAAAPNPNADGSS